MADQTPESYLERRKQEIASGDSIPVSFDALEAAAKDRLDPGVFGFVAGGAGSEGTIQENRTAFDRWRIVPRVLRDVAERDLSVELFGRNVAAPLMLAPIGFQSVYDDEAEVATARAAARLDVPMILSTGSSRSIEEVAEVMGDAPRWFQLYWAENPDVTVSFVDRAETAGYDGIVLTVDSQVAKWRPRGIENGFSILQESTAANYATDPVVKREYDLDNGEQFTETSSLKNPELTWGDLSFLLERTDLPVVLKGILHPEDAALAVEHGADGVLVSNHGGRQIDGAIGAMDALPGVVDAVGGEIPVLLDSGVRGGGDAFKALALGADAVCLGRPYIYGLSVAGEKGVYEVTHNYLAELDSLLGLAGCTSFEEVDSSLVVERSR